MAHNSHLEMEDLTSYISPSPAPADGDAEEVVSRQELRRKPAIPRKPVKSTFTEESDEMPAPSPLHRPRGNYRPIQGGSTGPSTTKAWVTGIWEHFPWRVILPFTICVLSLAAAIAVLIVSDGQPVSEWSVTPAVILALLTTIVNVSLRLAFKQGAAISWWYRAVRGASLDEMHEIWASGNSFWSALGAGRHWSFLSVASIAVTLVVLDQPLIQRASTIISVPHTSLTNIATNIAPEIPWGYTGYQPGRAAEDLVMTRPMIAAFHDFNQQVPMMSGFSDCPGTCTGYIEAGGLAAQCQTLTGPVQYLQDYALDLTITPDNQVAEATFDAESVFSVNFTFSGSEHDPTVPGADPAANNTQIMMVAAYSQNPTGLCAATRTQRTCYLAPATMSYPVTIQNNTLTLGDLINDATVVAFMPSVGVDAPVNNSLGGGGVDGGGDYTSFTIGGFYMAAQFLFNSNATYSFQGAVGTQIELPDTLSNQYLTLPTAFDTPQACNSSWSDPTDQILSTLNQIAFRVSLRASTAPYRYTNNTPPPFVSEMEVTTNVNVFHSDHKYMIAMIVLTFVFMGLVVPSFIGWWDLGRHVTLDPLEIAKAFEAPLLEGPGSNAPLRALAHHYGRRMVKYGESSGYVNGQLVKRQLKLGHADDIMTPVSGTVFE